MVHLETERPSDFAAREALLDRVMGRARVLKPSERLRRGRLPRPAFRSWHATVIAWSAPCVCGT